MNWEEGWVHWNWDTELGSGMSELGSGMSELGSG